MPPWKKRWFLGLHPQAVGTTAFTAVVENAWWTSHDCDLREEALSEGYTAMSRRPSSRFHLYHVCHLQQHQSRALHTGASASLQIQVQYSRDKC